MPLHVVFGRANTGKSGRVYEAVCEAVASGQRTTLILPSVRDVERARAELSLRVPLGLSVTTPAAFIESKWAECGDGRRLVSAGQRLSLVEGCCSRLGAQPALGRLAAACIDRLAQEVGEAWREGATRVPLSGVRLRSVISQYAQVLSERGLLEAGEAVHRLALIEEWRGECIALHRFNDFSRGQMALISGARRQNDVLLTLTAGPGLPAGRSAESLIETLTPDSREELREPPFHTEQVLCTVADGLFGTKTRIERSPCLRLGVAEGLRAEAALIADIVADTIITSEIAPGDVAVVFRDPVPHCRSLRTALCDAGIPAQFDLTEPLVSTSLGGAVVDTLRFALSGKKALLFRVLRTPFSGLDPVVSLELERQWRRTGESSPDHLVNQLETHQPALARRLRELRQMRSRQWAPSNLSKVAELVCWMHAHAASPMAEDDAAQRAIVHLIEELDEVADDETTWEALLRALTDAAVDLGGRERSDRVQVTSAMRLRGRRFHTVVIAGLNAGEFPAVPAEIMLPGSAVSQVLIALGDRPADTDTQAFEEALFYECFTRARSQVVLVTRATDDDGETLAKSSFYEEVVDFFRDPGTQERLEPDLYYPISPLPSSSAVRPRERLLAQAVALHQDNGRVAAARARAMSRGSEACVMGTGELPQTFSATQIEAYLSCPYRWFHQYAVQPRELEEEYGARAEGEYCHRLLAVTYARLMEADAVPVTPAGLAHALGVLDEAERDAIALALPTASTEERIGRMRAKAWARRVLAEDAARGDDFATRHVEWEFGRDPEVVDLGGFRLVGRIDRIDVDREGRALVVDYKRKTSPSHGAKKLVEDGKVQLPLYLAVVRQALGVEPVGGIYRGLASGGERGMFLEGFVDPVRITRGECLSAADFARVVDEGLALATAAVDGMRRGDVEAKPRSDASCWGCPIADTCGSRK